jgi:hypothetical protein
MHGRDHRFIWHFIGLEKQGINNTYPNCSSLNYDNMDMSRTSTYHIQFILLYR